MTIQVAQEEDLISPEGTQARASKMRLGRPPLPQLYSASAIRSTFPRLYDHLFVQDPPSQVTTMSLQIMWQLKQFAFLGINLIFDFRT